MYSIHIEFEDGSDSYVRYNMIGDEYREAIRKWSKYYYLRMLDIDGDMIFYLATSKNSIVSRSTTGEDGKTP